MRGMLSFMILWLLTKEPMHGQRIAEEIARRRGVKPTPGTIYPALKDLAEKGLIRGEREGKLTVYRLTSKGRAGIEEACEYFCRVFSEIFRECGAKR
ncbi:MAG: PadR family transcriptional regulator [Candidatus Verstraetearchaeota archaeon]|nr:PadR family transcriptional regulator [Candidatus Verstraetearchaeota archaeon]